MILKINSQNANKINSYIRDFPDCKLKDYEKVRIQDKLTRLDVFRLPLDSLFYNVENGRFAAEYLQLKKKIGRELKSEDPNDVKEIEKMLREQSISRSEWLKNDLKDNGQEEPGIITHDGYVVNGNRRMSVLSLLAKEDPKYGYINVGRLPDNVSESDIYKIELGKQLARDQKLDYGPINELLKIKQGITAGLSPEQISKTIGFSVDEIKEKLDRLILIEEYLQFIEEPKNYKAAEGVHEHFIDLQNQIFNKKTLKQKSYSPLDLLTMKKVAYSVIQQGVPHMQIRKIPKAIEHPKIKPIFIEAGKFVKTDPKKTKDHFDACLTRIKAEEDRDRPFQVLNAILGNLEALDIDNPELKKAEYKLLIKKIVDRMQDLSKLV